MGRMAMPKELNRKGQTLEIGSLKIDFLETGSGYPVIVFPAKASDFIEPFVSKVAESHRVIYLNLSSSDFVAAEAAEKLPRALTGLGIEQYAVMGISGGAGPALALAIAAPERINRLILLSPLQLSEGAELLDLARVQTATLVMVGTRDTSSAIEVGRLCREKIQSCHLSFVYGAGHDLTSDRPEACLDPIMQFLQEGEQFIIYRESQVIRP
jgi:pimeloyl-ACP methyl ester carboxylesterase